MFAPFLQKPFNMSMIIQGFCTHLYGFNLQAGAAMMAMSEVAALSFMTALQKPTSDVTEAKSTMQTASLSVLFLFESSAFRSDRLEAHVPHFSSTQLIICIS